MRGLHSSAKGSFALLLALVLSAAACGGRERRPVEIALDEEICAQCRMAVSQREFAGEFVSPHGEVLFFDDVGCLARWVVERASAPEAGLFVVDYATGEWLDARTVSYLASERLQTPMGSGHAAFDRRAAADGARDELGGRVLTWNELIDEAAP